MTSGVFELDGGTWEVDNNVRVVGNDEVGVDAAHDAKRVMQAIDDRDVIAVVCTHGQNDHVTFAPQLGEDAYAPVLVHPGDDLPWLLTQEMSITDAQRIGIHATAAAV